MRVTADTTVCISSGQCAFAMPEVFDQSEDTGTVRLLTGTPPEHLWAAVHNAAGTCPVGAITVREP